MLPMKKLTIAVVVSLDDRNTWEYNEFLYNIQNSLPNSNVRYIVLEYHQRRRTSIGTTCAPKAFVKILLGDQTFEITELSNPDIYSPPVLQQFFEHYVLSGPSGITFGDPATNRHFLFTWGHGSGLGFLYKQPSSDFMQGDDGQIFPPIDFDTVMLNRTILATNLSLPVNDLTDQAIVAQQSFDQQTKVNVINAKTLNLVLNNSYLSRGIVVEYFFAMNCYMQTFEVGYELKTTVKYMFATQRMMRFAGFDYGSFFYLLSMTPNASHLDIKNNIFDSFADKYKRISSSPRFLSYRDLPLTVSFNKIKDYGLIKDVVLEPFFKLLLDNLQTKVDCKTTIRDLVLYCRSNIPDLNNVLTPLGYIDFYDFFILFYNEVRRYDFHLVLILNGMFNNLEFFRNTIADFYNRTFDFAAEQNRMPRFFSIFFPDFKKGIVGNMVLNNTLTAIQIGNLAVRDSLTSLILELQNS